MIAGIHIEGPSISSKDGPRGAHPREHIRSPSIEEFENWQEAAGGLVAMITIAPELDGAIDYLREVAKRGVIVALGHSDASEEDIYKATEAGARMSTHLGNGLCGHFAAPPQCCLGSVSGGSIERKFDLRWASSAKFNCASDDPGQGDSSAWF